MDIDMSSFGGAISSQRKAKGMSQKELASKIIKEDGQAITPQYINDIEHDRRSPSSDHIIRQFSKVLGIDEAILFPLSGVLAAQDQKLVHKSTPQKVEQAYTAFRRTLKS